MNRSAISRCPGVQPGRILPRRAVHLRRTWVQHLHRRRGHASTTQVMTSSARSRGSRSSSPTSAAARTTRARSPRASRSARSTDTYAFIGLERAGGIMVHDITAPPRSPAFVTHVNNRDLNQPADGPVTGDTGPEGLTFMPAAESPNGRRICWPWPTRYRAPRRSGRSQPGPTGNPARQRRTAPLPRRILPRFVRGRDHLGAIPGLLFGAIPVLGGHLYAALRPLLPHQRWKAEMYRTTGSRRMYRNGGNRGPTPTRPRSMSRGASWAARRTPGWWSSIFPSGV